MDDLKRPTFWIGQILGLVVLMSTIAWHAGGYPDRAEVKEIVNQALVSAANPYTVDAPAIARVINRYDRDMEALDTKLDTMSQQLQELVVEVRLLARKR